MDLLNNDINFNSNLQNNIEVQQKQKQEYKHLGTYFLSRGMTLFSYDWNEDKIEKIVIKYSNTIYVECRDGKLVAVDKEVEKVMVDSRLTFFEALNMDNAIKRVNKYKSGKIVDLCNLRTEINTNINFFN
jgi:hypothetical protein